MKKTIMENKMKIKIKNQKLLKEEESDPTDRKGFPLPLDCKGNRMEVGEEGSEDEIINGLPKYRWRILQDLGIHSGHPNRQKAIEKQRRIEREACLKKYDVGGEDYRKEMSMAPLNQSDFQALQERNKRKRKGLREVKIKIGKKKLLLRETVDDLPTSIQDWIRRNPAYRAFFKMSKNRGPDTPGEQKWYDKTAAQLKQELGKKVRETGAKLEDRWTNQSIKTNWEDWSDFVDLGYGDETFFDTEDLSGQSRELDPEGQSLSEQKQPKRNKRKGLREVKIRKIKRVLQEGIQDPNDPDSPLMRNDDDYVSDFTGIPWSEESVASEIERAKELDSDDHQYPQDELSTAIKDVIDLVAEYEEEYSEDANGAMMELHAELDKKFGTKFLRFNVHPNQIKRSDDREAKRQNIKSMERSQLGFGETIKRWGKIIKG